MLLKSRELNQMLESLGSLVPIDVIKIISIDIKEHYESPKMMADLPEDIIYLHSAYDVSMKSIFNILFLSFDEIFDRFMKNMEVVEFGRDNWGNLYIYSQKDACFGCIPHSGGSEDFIRIAKKFSLYVEILGSYGWSDFTEITLQEYIEVCNYLEEPLDNTFWMTLKMKGEPLF
ncbi:hypothetical protein MF271_23230 (plasmid) [Deinococcus sp. KNUC1210]|uniref:hypothetical protein n=1 Tax=Deinococcus sp. KNUC1210 TaxID=2917691 RepID=UPI001EEFE9A9|nr:hypothetical protein [Deinococcus sp. KNUC1210]ULH17891.1 hypothetical protein MF271_23230 [Deinococcus sp. KNUC1210]